VADETVTPERDPTDVADPPVAPQPVRNAPPDNPEVPEADAWEQADEVTAGPRPVRPSSNPEVPEADAWEQAQEVPLDDEDAAGP
jgi:hypothetical protein